MSRKGPPTRGVAPPAGNLIIHGRSFGGFIHTLFYWFTHAVVNVFQSNGAAGPKSKNTGCVGASASNAAFRGHPPGPIPSLTSSETRVFSRRRARVTLYRLAIGVSASNRSGPNHAQRQTA